MGLEKSQERKVSLLGAVVIQEPTDNRWNRLAASLMNQTRFLECIAVLSLFSLTSCGAVPPNHGTHGNKAGQAADQGNSLSDEATDPIADLVLGQIDFVHSGTNAGGGAGFVTDVGLNDPSGIAIDRSVIPNRIYVSDFNNNRVLGWNDISALTNGAPADLVIGQPDFSSRLCNQARGGLGPGADTLCAPMGMAVDGAGNLYVADRGNFRVLVYFTPFTTDTLADRVLGQPNLTTGGCKNQSPNTATASSLCAPYGVTVDGGGNVYVADYSNNRVVEYNDPLGSCSTCDMVADRVLGQPNFTATGAGSDAMGLNQPSGLTVDSASNVFVVDFQNNRVLEYDNPLGGCSTCDSVADRVFGQPDFTSAGINNGGGGITSPSASGLLYPETVVVDGAGNLYVTDHGNSRVLRYNLYMTTDTVADLVFGQIDFTTNGCDRGGVSAGSLCLPFGVATDSGDNLWVSDFANNRVLRYGNPGGSPPPPTSDEVTIPSASFHFEEIKAPNCPLQYEVEFSFEKIPGDPTSGDGGHTTDDTDPSSVIAMMTFPGGFMTYGVVDGKEDYSTTPPGDYAKEFEVIFDCSTMTAHVFTDQDVTIHVSGTLSGGHTFSGTGVIKTHP